MTTAHYGDVAEMRLCEWLDLKWKSCVITELTVQESAHGRMKGCFPLLLMVQESARSIKRSDLPESIMQPGVRAAH